MKKYIIFSVLALVVGISVVSADSIKLPNGEPFQALQSAIDELWVAVNNIELLPGPQGDKGDKGDKGDQGEQGPVGQPSWDENRITSLESRITELESLFLDKYGEWIFTQMTFDSGVHQEFPSINDSGEIVWEQNVNGIIQIISLVRGQITLNNNQHGRPNINNNGEIVYQEELNGYWQILSTDRGQITSGDTNHTDPFINNNGEIIWIENSQIYSNINGQLTNSSIHIAPAINSNGEYVWQVSESNRTIMSSTRGVITNNGLSPSINDSGEIVWFEEISGPYQIFSSLRGQITNIPAGSFWDQAFYPDINNNGDIVYNQGVNNFLKVFKASWILPF